VPKRFVVALQKDNVAKAEIRAATFTSNIVGIADNTHKAHQLSPQPAVKSVQKITVLA
jgi:hypothetical protein